MARPKKSGLEYYPVDVDILQDIRIKKLIHRYGGGRALSIYIALLSQIYKKGYYFDYDDDTAFLVSIDLHEEESFVNQVIANCIDIGLFDKDTFNKYKVLTSAGIQKRYSSVVSTCKRTASIDKYNLLDKPVPKEEKAVSSEETKVISEETHINSEETKVLGEETKVNGEKTGENSDKTAVNSVKSTQKKSKSKVNILYSSSPSPARAKNEEKKDDKWEKTIEQEMEYLQKDSDWKKETCKKLELHGGDAEIMSLLMEYRGECVCQGRKPHDNETDLKQHFLAWYRKVYGSNKDISAKRKPKQASPPIVSISDSPPPTIS